MFDDKNVFEVKKTDTLLNEKVDALLVKEGIKRDKYLDYTCVLLDDNDEVVATGSAYKNTIRCLAVDSAHQGEGLIARIVSHLKMVQFERGNVHFFAYTKPQAAQSFVPLGLYEIERCPNKLVFMENKKNGFDEFLNSLPKCNGENISSVVMNANPFTLGHKYLLETASRNSDFVYVFVLSEDVSDFPFEARIKLVKEGCKEFKNIKVRESGPYIISSATFPDYFLKNEDEGTMVHGELDARLFLRIAKCLNIKKRYVGDEPFSPTTNMYNSVLCSFLSNNGISVNVIPRCKENDIIVSASQVRECLKNGDMNRVKMLVPPSTFEFLLSREGQAIIEKIRHKM